MVDKDFNNGRIEIEPMDLWVDVTKLPKGGMSFSHICDEEQLGVLQSYYELLSVEEFYLTAKFFRWRSDGVRVQCDFSAKIRQQCVVSGEPVTQAITENFEAFFVRAGSKLIKPEETKENEIFLDVDVGDPPEIFDGRKVDLGRLVCEYFSLSINPFPRKSGVKLAKSVTMEKPEQAKDSSPFATLKNLNLD